jgi:hypothetical protein
MYFGVVPGAWTFLLLAAAAAPLFVLLVRKVAAEGTLVPLAASAAVVLGLLVVPFSSPEAVLLPLGLLALASIEK